MELLIALLTIPILGLIVAVISALSNPPESTQAEQDEFTVAEAYVQYKRPEVYQRLVANFACTNRAEYRRLNLNTWNERNDK